MIDCRYYRSKIRKSLTDGSITSMKMRPKESIDSIDRYYRYRSIADCAYLWLEPTDRYWYGMTWRKPGFVERGDGSYDSTEFSSIHNTAFIAGTVQYQRWAPAIFSLVRFRWSAI